MTTTQGPADRLQPTGTGETLTSGDTENDSILAAGSRPIPYAVRVRFMTRRDLERTAVSLSARERRCRETNDPDGADQAARRWQMAVTELDRRDAELVERERRRTARMHQTAVAWYAARGENR